MKRALFLGAPLFALVACQSQSLTPSSPKPTSSVIPASTVNDSCSAYKTSADCQSAVGKTVGIALPATNVCTWTPVDACPAGASCPTGVCVATSACASLTSASSCQANSGCVWSAIVATAASPALCPVGQSCDGGGFCFERGSSVNGCFCVQPVACPANGSCPPVQCDCPPPQATDGGSASGGGTCTCDCPPCLAGEVCPVCDCACGQPGGGCSGGTGSTGSGGATGTGGGPGTCTCNCPACPAGETCPACSCACGHGATTTTTIPSSGTGGASGTVSDTGGSGSATGAVCGCPACPEGAACAPCGCGTTPPADPCTAHTDVTSCTADTTDACGWTSLNIECITTPCPTGTCAQTTPVPPVDGGAGGGCACACPACTPGETCPPCACDCCPAQAPSGTPVTLQPQPVGASGSIGL